ncbi:MAG: hypothetical protein WAP47_14990 [Candidatus Rokuibacteriota bacterium]
MLLDILRGEIPATIEQSVTFPDPTGKVSSYQPGGATTTASNAFFSSDITTNGRTCFTCHQPQNDWEISPPQIRAQLLLTRGRSALFQPIDAADCPSSPGATARFPDPRFVTARTQLFKRGNFRISLNAPNPLGPQKPDPSFTTFAGITTPEWVLTVEHDPFGCQLDPEHGLPANLISVYRRPLPSTNVAFLAQNGPLAKLDIMWDAREPNLETQFVNATLFHGQTTIEPDATSIAQGVQFQSGMFTAQSYDNRAGDLTGGDGSGATGGPNNLYDWRQGQSPACSSPFGALVCAGIKVKQTLLAPVILPDGTILVDSSGTPKNLSVNVASELYSAFATPTTRNRVRTLQRESIARGEAIFSGKVFTIDKVAGLNDIKGSLNGEPGTCSTCHSNKNVVNDTAADPKRLGIMDNSTGVNVMPATPDFPRFAFYCPTGSMHFFSNPVTSSNCPGGGGTCNKFITTDPGKGLITGKCDDLGRMKVPILRGLAARAPYFHGGNAATLMDLVNFYDQRFDIRLTYQEKADLINYLNSL